MGDVTDGRAAPWSRDDEALFRDDEDADEAVCAACNQPLVVGQMVQERPAFSLHFYHARARDCVAAPEDQPQESAP